MSNIATQSVDTIVKMSTFANNPIDLEQVVIRPYTSDDTDAVLWLYEDGLLEGQIPVSDTGADIDNIEEAYLNQERNGFWIAEYNGKVVGMVGVAEGERNTAEIRRLRVDPALQLNGIGFKLIEQAVQFCHHHNYLKVVLDTRIRQGPAVEIFEKFAFQQSGSKEVNGKELLEFYLDLYREVKEDD